MNHKIYLNLQSQDIYKKQYLIINLTSVYKYII